MSAGASEVLLRLLRKAAARRAAPAPGRMKVEEVEPRILHSADLTPFVAGAAAAPQAEIRVLEAVPASANDASSAQHATRRELVVVDAATPDYQKLVDDIVAHADSTRVVDVLVIERGSDGLEQIGDALKGRADLDALHIVSHGAAGAIFLGRDTIDAHTLAANPDPVAAWAGAFGGDADILIYGCDVAATAEGRAMLQTLAALTGADVSSSVDATGAAALGGDWDLEYAIGSIEAHLALSQDAQDEWFGLLATASLQPTQDTYLDQDAPTLNFGTATTLVVNPNNSHGDHALLQFDLGSLPAGGTISSAVLKMQAITVERDMNVEVHAVTQAWTEGTVDGAAGAASWNQRVAGTAWTTAGGTYDPAAAAIHGADSTGQHTWDLTALVQSWLDGTRANNGVVLIGSGTTSNSDVVYASREGATAPVLVLTYNTAPVLDAALSPTLAVANQNAPAPYGATGTLVSNLVDFATPAGQVDNVTDSDAGAVTGIAVTAADTSNGSWWYTTNGGSTWSALGAVSATSSRLLAADANTRVYFQAGATVGTIANALSFHAWDRTSGANGALADPSVTGGMSAFSVAGDTASVTIAMNAAPTLPGTPNDLAPINEDASSNAGTRVSALLSGLVADANSQAVSGIAVSGVDNTNGTWQYTRNGGSTWSAFGAVSAGSARLLAADALTSVRFVPNANWNGVVTNGITFRAWDQTSGTAGGTADTTSAPFTVRDNFSAVSYSNNDGSASWSAGWVDSDGNAGGGQIQVTGNHLQFDGGSSATSSIYRDVNLAGSSSAILSFTFNNSVSPGAMRLEISSDGGTSYTTLASSFAAGAGSATFDVTAHAATATRIRFTVDGDSGLLLGLGAGGPFSVDNLQIAYARPLTGGASAFSSATASAGITVASVNDAPRGASNTVTTLEDTAFVFNASHFGFSDTSDTPANAFAAVRIFSLPGDGRLRLNGVGVTFGQLVSVASIDAGDLVYTPDANGDGAGYARFTFQVKDDGGTLNGGVDSDATLCTLTIDVTPVNDAPRGANNTVVAIEDTTGSFTRSMFGFSDPADSPDNAFSAVTITTLATAGTLALNGAAVTAGQSIGIADIDAGRFTFRAAANASGAGYATFTFQVKDAGGTLDGGVDLDPTARTMTIDVNPVDDAPVGTSATVTAAEDTAFVFNAAAFGFTDPNDTPADSLLAVRISSLPSAGTLRLNGVAVVTGQYVSAANINAGRLVYTPGANGSGAGYASFTFQVQDDGGTSDGGANLDPVARVLTIDVTPRNDAPAGANATVTTREDVALVFTTAAFGFSDVNDSPANAFLAVKIGALPAQGALTLNGVTVAAGQFVSAADIDAGRLVYTPGANGSGAAYASFTFQLRDDGGTVGGGVDLDAVARTMTIAVTAVNDAPAGTSATLTMNEDTALVLSAASFGFTDANDAPGNGLAAVNIASLPQAGTLTLDGAAVTAGQVVTAANIAAGRLVYTAATNASGAAYASFAFQVQDDGGGANGGADTDPVARTLTIDVVAVNDAPAGANATRVTLEDTPLVFSTADFGYTDSLDTPADSLGGVKIASLPTAGVLKLNGAAVTAGQVVSAADISAGALVYTPAANANGAAAASFTFRVQDSGGTAGGGIDLDPVARILTIDVTPVNDAPVGTNHTAFTPPNTALVFDAAAFGYTDPADTPANSMIAVRIDSLPSLGALTLGGALVTAGQSVALADLAAGRLVYTPGFNGTGAAYSGFTFRVQDSGGGADLDTTARSMTINVGVLNVAPIGTGNTLATREDTPLVFDAAAFGYSDPDDTPSNAFVAVKIATLPSAGVLTLAGAALTAGQTVSVVDIAAGRLVYTPGANASGAAYASFGFQVQDDGAGVTLDPLARTMTIDVTAVNDAPAGADGALAALEDTALVVPAAAFGFTDTIDTPAGSLSEVRIASLPLAGVLTLGGIAVAAGDFVSVADLDAGRLVFTPGVDANGAAYASFTFQVRDGGGTADGGSDLDPVARTLTFNVAPVNDAPSGTGGTVAMTEDTAVVLGLAVFGFTDANDASPNALSAVKITTLPGAGTLELGGVALTAGELVSAADIGAGKLVYTPGANGAGAGYASFTFQVRDDGGLAGGGMDTDPVAKTIAFDVAGVNDAPRGTASTVLVGDAEAYALHAAAFGYTDPDDSPANAFAGVTLVSTPLAGTLTLHGAAVSAGQFVAAADLASGALVYTPGAGAASVPGAPYASLTFRVHDDGGGNDTDPAARTLDVGIRVPAIAPSLPPTEALPAAPPEVLTESVAAAAPAPASSAPAAPAAAPVKAAAKPAVEAPVPGNADLLAIGATLESGSGAVIVESGPVQRAAADPPGREQRDFAAAFVPVGQALLGTLMQAADSALTLVVPQAQAASSAAASPADNQALVRALDQMREGMDEQGRLEASAAATSAAVGVSFSVGYVVWLLRGGVVLSTLLSSLPAWRMIDPLPVLGRMDDDEDDGDDDSLESLVANKDGDAGDDTAQPAARTEAT